MSGKEVDQIKSYIFNLSNLKPEAALIEFSSLIEKESTLTNDSLKKNNELKQQSLQKIILEKPSEERQNYLKLLRMNLNPCKKLKRLETLLYRSEILREISKTNALLLENRFLIYKSTLFNFISWFSTFAILMGIFIAYINFEWIRDHIVYVSIGVLAIWILAMLKFGKWIFDSKNRMMPGILVANYAEEKLFRDKNRADERSNEEIKTNQDDVVADTEEKSLDPSVSIAEENKELLPSKNK